MKKLANKNDVYCRNRREVPFKLFKKILKIDGKMSSQMSF